MNKGLLKIKKYENIILVYPSKPAYLYPRRVLHRFKKFCIENKLRFKILNEVYDDIVLKRGDLFIIIEETDLVKLIKKIREDEYVLGEEIGIISYNDTPLKELLEITVMPTDFYNMSKTGAKMILNKEKRKVKILFNFIYR